MTEFQAAPRIPLTKGQRIGVALLCVFLVATIGAVFVQFKSNLYAYAERHPTNGILPTDLEALAKNQNEALKKADTDSDGLNDYDELYLYHTSAYNKDTDSDGSDDGVEVQRGTSPVCPEGKDCSLNNFAATTTPVSDFTLGANIGGQANTSTAVSAPQFTAQQIREALEANGVPKGKLDEFSDSDLMQLYEQTIKENSPKVNSTQSAAAGMTPAQLRESLLQYGVKKQDLDKISDDDLLKVFEEALANAQ